jgi:hypothetical protein
MYRCKWVLQMRVQAIFSALLLSLALTAHGAVHVYTHETFAEVSDALIFKGGHEGMFHTRESEDDSSTSVMRKGQAHAPLDTHA